MSSSEPAPTLVPADLSPMKFSRGRNSFLCLPHRDQGRGISGTYRPLRGEGGGPTFWRVNFGFFFRCEVLQKARNGKSLLLARETQGGALEGGRGPGNHPLPPPPPWGSNPLKFRDVAVVVWLGEMFSGYFKCLTKTWLVFSSRQNHPTECHATINGGMQVHEYLNT